MKLLVNAQQRFAKMRAHTAAHLLHAELVKIFPGTKQAGSFVDEDVLRFDFVADRLLSGDEMLSLQQAVNGLIYRALPVDTQETSFDNAVAHGAKAFFEDKYGDVVRMVVVAEQISTELCGGTHVSNTKDIGAFVIIGQETVASGVKRIVAYTGPKVVDIMVEQTHTLQDLGQILDVVSTKQLLPKLEKVLKEFDDMKNRIEGMESKIIHQLLTSSVKGSLDFQKIFLVPVDMNFKMLVTQAQILFPQESLLLLTSEGNFALLGGLVSAKELALKLSLKGGGNERLVQGRDPQVLSFII